MGPVHPLIDTYKNLMSYLGEKPMIHRGTCPEVQWKELRPISLNMVEK